MAGIDQIDPNFKVKTSIDKEDIRFYDVRQEPFCVHGLFYEDGKFRRLPQAVAESINDGVRQLHAKTSGGRVRFKTNSPYIAIHAEMSYLIKVAHAAITGSNGFDLYVRTEGQDRHIRTFVPPFDMTNGYESVIELGSSMEREITLYFPRSAEVNDLRIGLSETATLSKPDPYVIEKPIVYYGSSITQGACATRSGSDYISFVSRRLHADYINLGFSGSALGETAMAEYINTLDMSVFVLDYDYNAPDVEHLRKTHEPFFSIIREAHPDLPILILSRPTYRLNEWEEKRLEVVRATYQHALDKGDTNVYFIDGPTLMALAKTDGTVDGCHPTDLGFFSMAQAVGDVLEPIVKSLIG